MSRFDKCHRSLRGVTGWSTTARARGISITEVVVGCVVPDASPFDAGVITDGLCPDELDWFVQRRKELSAGRGSDDPEILVAAHTVDVNRANWARFLDDLELHLEINGPNSLSRGDVTHIACECGKDQEWLPLLVAAYMWGWGKSPIGPQRLAWVLEGRDGEPAPDREEIERRLKAAFDALDISAGRAYELLTDKKRRIRYLGPAFFTKFLYFAGKTVAMPCPPMVLDARLAERMRWFWDRRRGKRYAAGGRDPAWLWRPPCWSTYRYRVYLAFLHRAAEQLSQAGPRWTADLVELILFQNDPGDTLPE
jgi:hypothetical protein